MSSPAPRFRLLPAQDPVLARVHPIRASDGGNAPDPVDELGLALLHPIEEIFKIVFDAFMVVDGERYFRRLNSPAVELLGAPPKAILGSRIDDFTSPDLHAVMEGMWAELNREGMLAGAYEVLRGDGQRRLVEFRARRDFDAGQHLIVARPAPPHLLRAPASVCSEPQLTPREREVIQLAADGGSLRDIAEQLFVAEQTVKSHFENIHTKLGVRNRAAAVATALRRGLIE